MYNFNEIFAKCLQEKNGNIDEALKIVLNKTVTEAVNSLLQTEMTAILGYEKNQDNSANPDNIRNGSYTRQLDTIVGPIEVVVPRDRKAEFHSPIIPKYKRRTEQISDIIVKLYQSNLSTEEVKLIIESLYDTSYSKSTISRITDAVLEDVERFNNTPLDEDWFAVFLDATYVPLRRDMVSKEAINLVMGINYEGESKILAYNITGQESAENYRELLSSLKIRGVKNIEIIVSDDLSGIDEAIDKTFASAERQRCYLHVLRNIVKNVKPKHREEISKDFMNISRQENKEIANLKLGEFCEKRSKYYKFVEKYKAKSKYYLTFYKYPIEIRKLVYSNNRIEAYNKQIKRLTKVREQFVTEDALNKQLVSMFLRYNAGCGTKKVKNWLIINELKFEK